MNQESAVLAIDIGASNGRAVLGFFDGEEIALEEVHRFPNEPIMKNGTMCWDTETLFEGIKTGIIKAKEFGEIQSIGIDTWGVDFGLLDGKGKLLQNPVHYRDKRTEGILDTAFKRITERELYFSTGNQIMEINTAFQLLSLSEKQPDLLASADCLLLMPDLFNYLLTGVKSTEQSIASTTQLLDSGIGSWSSDILDAFGIKESLFTKITSGGTILAPVSDKLCRELNIASIPVISVAGHDTQCAQLAVPAEEASFVFISSGTWSLLGTELDAPLIHEQTYRNNFTNELGFGGKTSLLKNITGLWLIQECRRQWKKEGYDYSFSELEAMAKSSPGFTGFIDPDNPEFSKSGDLPGRIREFCFKTGQVIPENYTQVVNCIYGSLALKYRHCMNQLEQCTGCSYPAVHIVGGGAKDEYLSQLAADATGKIVFAGPEEATVLGNLCIQLLTLGKISDIKSAREMIRNSQKVKQFIPADTAAWDIAYKRFWK